MPDFWLNSGYHLLDKNEDGHLVITDDFLRAYFLRPEVRPVDESCDAERELHEKLVNNPQMSVTDNMIKVLKDPDGRENYEVLVPFRDRLLNQKTVEAAYLSLFSHPLSPLPGMFVDQLVHVILRNVLDGINDPFQVRAAEIFFRDQKVTIQDGNILLGDTEVVEMYAATGGWGALGALIAQAGTETKSVEMDVLRQENASIYWPRAEKHDIVLDMSFTRPGLDGFCRVLEGWVGHLLGVKVAVQPVQKITDEKWVWHLGLDKEASGLLNDLYNGEDVGEDRLENLLSLFRLDFSDPLLMREDIRGRPVYMGLCMSPGKDLKLKPQNILVNLPLAQGASLN